MFLIVAILTIVQTAVTGLTVPLVMHSQPVLQHTMTARQLQPTRLTQNLQPAYAVLQVNPDDEVIDLVQPALGVNVIQ